MIFSSFTSTSQPSCEHCKNAQRPGWQLHTRLCLASLTSLTVPPLPHTQSHGVHFQTQPGLRQSSQNSPPLTAPSLFGWTILPEGLPKTQPAIDATRRRIILHPVATTTPHNVSGNAVCCRTSFDFRGQILTFSICLFHCQSSAQSLLLLFFVIKKELIPLKKSSPKLFPPQSLPLSSKHLAH